jgi:hypothetical protein
MINALLELGSNTVTKAAMLVRVYNKPDSAITRIEKRAKRQDKLFFHIRIVIAALISV